MGVVAPPNLENLIDLASSFFLQSDEFEWNELKKRQIFATEDEDSHLPFYLVLLEARLHPNAHRVSRNNIFPRTYALIAVEGM